MCTWITNTFIFFMSSSSISSLVSFLLSSLHNNSDQLLSHMYSPTDTHLYLLNSYSFLSSIRRIAIDEERLVLAFETLDVESKGKLSDCRRCICLYWLILRNRQKRINRTRAHNNILATYLCLWRGNNLPPDASIQFTVPSLTVLHLSQQYSTPPTHTHWLIPFSL